MFSTPTRDGFGDEEFDDARFDIMPETPAPLKARVNNLTNQVSELVRMNQNNEKRHKAETSRYKNELEEARIERDKAKAEAKAKLTELERCKTEGDGKMHEVSLASGKAGRLDETHLTAQLNLHSEILQQKAALVLAQEQMQIIELERRLVQAEAEKGKYGLSFVCRFLLIRQSYEITASRCSRPRRRRCLPRLRRRMGSSRS